MDKHKADKTLNSKTGSSKISIVTGPGQHIQTIIDVLKNSKYENQYIKTYPKIEVESMDINKKKNVNNYYYYIQYLTWGLWRKIPVLAKYETPKNWLLPLMDRIISKYITKCDLFIGWSQVSLASMKKARQLGAKVMLEHPMADVDTWMPLVKAEYDRWGNNKGYYSLFSNSIIKRMRKEREEADYINVLSSFAKNSFVKVGIAENKIITTSLGVNDNLFCPPDFEKKGRNKENLKILYVGRIELLKGIPYLLQAFSQIKRKDVELHLVGHIYPEMKDVLDKFADERIKIIGEVSNDELPSYYQDADLFVFPSVNDAFGLVVLEAMACGLPVITTENSCGTDVVTEGEDGFVIPIRDVQAIKEKIELFLENRELSQAMGEKARSKVESSFTLSHYEKRLINTYKAVLNSK